ncbi:mannose-1-phosphate guanylyltransferase [Chitinimonas prasina]|uniref:Mannose-1-phosphate guanylyltransferase n=1 Tax=Chitinimonas prasina TaxID=1434937 RepID=A0ABQ5YEQ0_9NEIS|nr:nucleotidyltransferase family protein [Chitinimonas prasina]GLR12113.1 mannose-1-phosphate guanylyltransferase [Chitinimonas prasina]
MRAMILAAGRGERMRPLTDTTPKPLLEVGGLPLIGWHLRRLAAAGIREVVINHAWLGRQIETTLGDGSNWGVNIQYSPEPIPLETAGGISQALPLLGDAPFLVVNGDVYTDYPFAQLQPLAQQLAETGGACAHLVLVPKPDYKTGFDLALQSDGKLLPHADGLQPLTFGGMALYTPAFFAEVPRGQPGPLLPWFLAGMAEGRITGECYTGQWLDVGTVERLEAARAACRVS